MKNARSALLLGGLAAAITVIVSSPGLTCGAFAGGPVGVEPASIRLDKQSALLWRVGKQEHMLLSVKYSGGSDEFAWVIPVESKPKVEVEKGAPFTELRKATEIVPPVPLLQSMRGGNKAGGGGPPVTVLERKEEGPYDIAVLEATSGGGLYQWLKENGFQVSKNAKGHLSYYIDRKFIFVAARIRGGAQGNQTVAARLSQGTIAPMHLTFKAKQLSYPLKMTAVNPGQSDMEIYVAGSLLPPAQVLAKVGPASVSVQTFQLTPAGQAGFAISGPPGLANPHGDFPTLRRLLPEGGVVSKFTGTLGDAQRQEDLVFARL